MRASISRLPGNCGCSASAIELQYGVLCRDRVDVRRADRGLPADRRITRQACEHVHQLAHACRAGRLQHRDERLAPFGAFLGVAVSVHGSEKSPVDRGVVHDRLLEACTLGDATRLCASTRDRRGGAHVRRRCARSVATIEREMGSDSLKRRDLLTVPASQASAAQPLRSSCQRLGRLYAATLTARPRPRRQRACSDRPLRRSTRRLPSTWLEGRCCWRPAPERSPCRAAVRHSRQTLRPPSR